MSEQGAARPAASQDPEQGGAGAAAAQDVDPSPQSQVGPVGQASPSMLLEVQEEYVPCFFRYVTAIARVAGIITVIVLWVITGHMLGVEDEVGTRQWYMISLSVTITIFELMWVINLCANKCKNEGCICACWQICVWLDNWKKTIFYSAIAIPCFIAPIMSAKTIIAGVIVVVAAFCYLMRSFKDSSCVRQKNIKYIQADGPGMRANLVSHEVQTATDAPPGRNYKAVQH